jgi:RNA polymerase sigma factor (TIGR02999 family)
MNSGQPSNDGLETGQARDATPSLPANDDLYALAYAELRRLAHAQLRGERVGHTLNTTALVHEAYVRLAERQQGWVDRPHFLALAAQAMRRILIDHARRHRSARRGGGDRQVVPLDQVEIPVEQRADALLALDDALTRLSAFDERRCRVVECRFFGGLSEAETAAALGVALRTVKRDWAKAKAWLYQELYSDDVAI